MWPIDAQRFRLVCSATSRAPSTTFWKSRRDRPCPWVTMQKRRAPAASAACACSRICSGVIIACIGVSASAKRDCAQKPQSSAQPPDLAFTSEHMSVESPNWSHRASKARSTSASMSARSSISPRAIASSYVISGGKAAPRYARPRTAWRWLAALPVGLALLAERPDALLEVLREEARLAQVDQLALELGRQRPGVLPQRPDRPLVAREREGRVGADLRGHGQRRLLQLVRLNDLVDQPHLVAAI